VSPPGRNLIPIPGVFPEEYLPRVCPSRGGRTPLLFRWASSLLRELAQCPVAFRSRRGQFPSDRFRYARFRRDYLAELFAPASPLDSAFALPLVKYRLLRLDYLD